MEPITGQLEATEVSQARRLNRGSAPGFRVLTLIFAVAPFCMIGTLIMGVIAGGPWQSLLTLFIPAILVTSGLFWLFSRGIPGLLEAQGPGAKGQLAPFEMRFTEEALVIHNQFGNKRLMWREVFKVVENRDLILVYRDGANYDVIPKRLLVSDADRAQMKQLISKARREGGSQEMHRIRIGMYIFFGILAVVVAAVSYYTSSAGR